MLLEVKKINAYYGHVHALKDVSIVVDVNEMVALLGNNGAGKTTLLKCISGLLKPTSGEIIFNGKRVDTIPCEEVVRLGISMAPEGRRLFTRSSIRENLEMGAYIRSDTANINKDIEELFELFPILKERKNQMAGTLSGGEQQMLCIARAMMSKPKLLLLDEPSLGLMPIRVNEVFEYIKAIHEKGTTILIVEQNAKKSLSIVERGYVIDTGSLVMEGTSEELRNSEQVKKAFLGE